MVLPLKNMVLAAIYIIIPGYYRIHGNKCPFSQLIIYKLALTVLSYFNVSFNHSRMFDCQPAFQVINEKETLIINKLFCFKICHNVHA